MHHKAGALAETLYVYGHAAKSAWEAGGRHFVTVGLGAGYIELVLLALARSQELSRGFLRVRSFEANAHLRSAFQAWLQIGSAAELGPFFDQVAESVASHFSLDHTTLRGFAKEAFENGQWTIEPELTPSTDWLHRADCIFFDAFSKNTSPELWEDDFLQQWLERSTKEDSTFSSYASNKSLRIALQKTGFTVTERKGFGGKRECTFAKRLPNLKHLN